MGNQETWPDSWTLWHPRRKRGSWEKRNLSLTHSPVGQLTSLQMIKTQTKWYLTTKLLLRIVIGSRTSVVSVVQWRNKNVMTNTCCLSDLRHYLYIKPKCHCNCNNYTFILNVFKFSWYMWNIIWNAIRWAPTLCPWSTYVAKTLALKWVRKLDWLSVLCWKCFWPNNAQQLRFRLRYMWKFGFPRCQKKTRVS